jgi:hypothetical protein
MALKNKKTASDMAVINKKYFGSEPVSFKCTNETMLDAFAYYNYMCDMSDAREYLVSYLLSNNRKDEARIINNIKECWIPTTAAWTARIISNGNMVSEYSLAFMNQKIDEAIKHKSEDDNSELDKKPNVQKYIKDKSNDIIANIEDILDSGYDLKFSYYTYFKSIEASGNVLKKIRDYYSPLLEEYRQIGVDKDITEGYYNLSKKDVTLRVNYLTKMISDIDALIVNKKQIRKTPTNVRSPKIKKINLIDFQYMKEDAANKIVSVDPNKLVDRKEAWLYNTKMNTLTVLYSDNGFSIKGTTIQNITEKSASKKIGASREKVLTRVLNDSRVALRKLMSDIKSAAQQGSGRTNENVLILRVF